MRLSVFKRDMKGLHLRLHRHRKFQLIITTGIVGTTAVSYLVPQYQEFVIVAATATNLVWIWE